MNAVFLDLVNQSITAGYVILAVLIIRVLLRKAPKRYSYMLWSVVAFRLCIPFSFSSVFSLFSLNLGKREVVSKQYGSALQYVTEQMTVSQAGISQIGEQAAEPGSYAGFPMVQDNSPVQTLVRAGMILWLLGMAVFVIYSAISYIRLKKRMDTAVLLEKNVYQSDKVSSPFIMGFFKPRIYIPFGLENKVLRYVLTHERYHLKRCDHLIKLFAFVLLMVYWFHPLCWFAYCLMCRDMEMSCDEKVLEGEAGISREYSLALLSFAANRRFPVPSPLSFGENGVKGRIKNVLGFRRCKVWIRVAAAVLCAATVIGCAGNPKEGNGTQDITDRDAVMAELTKSYTDKEAEAIYSKLKELVKYKTDDDFPDIAEIWIGATNNEDGYLAGTMILRDAAYKGLDYLSDVKVLEMDGSRWLSVTCRAIVEGPQGDELYDEDDFELLIPVTTDENGTVEFGEVKGTFHCWHEPIATTEDTPASKEKAYHSVEADVTHDGIPDHIVLFGAAAENMQMDEDVETFFSKTANWGYVRIYDGGDKQYNADNPGIGTPIWERTLSYAHVGNVQISITEQDGLEYLFISNMWEGQGAIAYDARVMSLDGEGREYTFAEYDIGYILTEDSVTNQEQKKEMTEFRDKIQPFYEGAYLVAALDIGDEKGVYISNEKRSYRAEEYYDSVWKRLELLTE